MIIVDPAGPSSNHMFTSSHLHILSFSHHIFWSSHLLIFNTSSHLLTFTSSYLHITSSHLLIFTSSHLHIFTSSHLHNFTSSHSLFPFFFLFFFLLFYFSLKARGSANETARNATLSHKTRFDRQKLWLNCDFECAATTLSHEMRFDGQKLTEVKLRFWVCRENPFARNEVRWPKTNWG